MSIHAHVLAVLANVAIDVWDTWRITEHVLVVVPEEARPEVLRVIAEHFGMAEHDDGSYTPETFLDSVHWFQGETHYRIIDGLRDLAADLDPERDEQVYGKARQRKRAMVDR
jgi:hypothetical protein